MSISPVPDRKFKKVTDIHPKTLRSMGISLLLLDLDNTVSPYKVEAPTDEIRAWADMMKKSGISLYFVSNNKGTRPEVFSKALNIPYVKRAGKPSTRGIVKVLELTGAKREETALCGDQVYTDILAANRAGITGILVEPIKFTNPFLAIRYFFELPFRHEKRKIK